MTPLSRLTVNVNLSDAQLPERKQCGWIYLIEAVGAGLLKIGLTTDVERRFAQLVGENAGELKLVAVMQGNQADERAVHELLRQHRGHGEWFRDCEEVRRLFC